MLPDHGRFLADAHFEIIFDGTPYLSEVCLGEWRIGTAQPGKIQQVIDQFGKPVRGAEDLIDVQHRFAIEPAFIVFLQQMREGGDLPERFLQIVTGHISKLFQVFIRPFQFEVDLDEVAGLFCYEGLQDCIVQIRGYMVRIFFHCCLIDLKMAGNNTKYEK